MPCGQTGYGGKEVQAGMEHGEGAWTKEGSRTHVGAERDVGGCIPAGAVQSPDPGNYGRVRNLLFTEQPLGLGPGCLVSPVREGWVSRTVIPQ